MAETESERRMAENEVVFRSFNEGFLRWQKEFKQVAAEQGHKPVEFNTDEPLEFYCECSDENCDKRIKLSPDDYIKHHKYKNTFIIVCGHEVDSIEKVILETSEYCVVKKNIWPRQRVRQLNDTPVDNS